MSTPPNPPSTPVGPPTEPAGTPTPETPEISEAPGTDSASAPTQPLSLEKTPAAPATPEAPEAPAAPATAASPPAPEAPAAAPAPEAPATTPQPAPAPSAFAPPPSAFAPPSPAFAHPTPPAAAGFGEGFGAPGFPGAPAAPDNQWGAPTPGYPGGTYPGYPQAAPTGNGLAVAAVITGGLGIILGIIPFFFWAGTLLAAVGLGLGIGGVVRANKGAPNKSMAVVGVVLSVLGLLASAGGLFLTVLVVDKADSRIDRQVEEDRRASERLPGGAPSRSAAPTQVPGLTSALPFGEKFTYPNGITVSLSVPTTYKPKGAYARERVKNAVELTVTITNNSNVPFDVLLASPNVRDDQGMPAESVYDGNMPKSIRGSLLPGETASGVEAFEVPEGTKSITADVRPGMLRESVKYAGPIG
ncbi:hypothetical protein [Streptomyces virginiae]|uniref:hypothetical protein n=1 Tax=Streptomyces virginiae TaxID=1961 RepID=UPI00225B3FE5|nr:hypothetical protein [Streptomyces virginiae]MCX4719992.1 DUF4352 domain-containing protein [Streptomyces virginiae]